MAGEDLTIIHVETVADLARWLEKNHQTQQSVWLSLNKKSSGLPYIPRQDLLRILLSFGWVDSLPRKNDENTSLLLISPRKTGSAWSKINKDIVETLERDNALTAYGKKVVEDARRDGSWSLLDDVENGVIPDDLAQALNQSAAAKQNFDAFPKSAKRAILEWLKLAKRPETRAKRIAETVSAAQNNQRVLDWRAKKSKK